MGSEYQSLTVHSKKIMRNHHHSKGKISHSRRDLSTIRCYTCEEKGHISKFFPNKGNLKKKKENKRRHHAHVAEDDESSTKRVKQESDSSSDEEYVLISILTGTVSHGSNYWLIDNGASKHMTGFEDSFVKLSEHESPHKMKLGDDYQFPIKESGKYSYKLDSRKSLKMKDVMHVPRFKKKFISISTLYEKGMRVAFVDGQVLMWPKGKTINDATVIGEQDEGFTN